MGKRNNDSDDFMDDEMLDGLCPEDREFYRSIISRTMEEKTDHDAIRTDVKMTVSSINRRYFRKKDRKHAGDTGISFDEAIEDEGFLRIEDCTPEKIHSYFDRYIVGQEETKETLAVAIYEHMKRMEIAGMEKSNILLVGPTGSGKTLFARCLANMLGVPFTIADASALTEAGYIGQDVESILTPLIQQAHGDIAEVERSVVFIDEIDKISKSDSHGSDVSRLGVQQGLLKLLEGSIVSVPSNKAAMIGKGVHVDVDTSNILFICGGAFPGLEDIVDKRSKDSSIGFFSHPLSRDERKEKLYRKATTEDFESFGMLPEFMGRLPVVSFLDPLEKETYRKILSEPENSVLKQYQRSFDYENASLAITDDAMDAIAEMAYRMGTGARALRSILDRTLRKVMYKLPSLEGRKMVIVTEDNIVNGTVPETSIVDEDTEKRKA